MKKTLFIFLCSCITMLFFVQKIYSQETIISFYEIYIKGEDLKDSIVEYIKILDEKGFEGETDDGKKAEPGVIIDDANWLYLPQGIIIFIPITNDAKDLIAAIEDKQYWVDLGCCRWIVWRNFEKNVLVFEDSGM